MTTPAATGIDWDAARRRIAQLDKALLAGEEPTAEDVEAILYLRAERLSRVIDDEADTAAGLDVMTVVLGGEDYAIALSAIRQVIRVNTLTLLPGTAPHFAGVRNLRGRPLLVVDLRVLLGLADGELTDAARIIVIGEQRVEYGLIVDAVGEVKKIPLADIQETPGSVAAEARTFLSGVTSDAIAVLDTVALSTDPRLWIDETNTF